MNDDESCPSLSLFEPPISIMSWFTNKTGDKQQQQRSRQKGVKNKHTFTVRNLVVPVVTILGRVVMDC